MRERHLTKEEIGTVMDCCGENLILRAAYSINIYTGIPLTYIFLIRTHHVDFTAWKLKYRNKSIPIPSEIRATLTEYFAYRNLILRTRGEESKWLFVSGNNKYSSHRSVICHLSKHVRKALGWHVKTHHLRNTALFLLSERGVRFSNFSSVTGISRRSCYNMKPPTC